MIRQLLLFVFLAAAIQPLHGQSSAIFLDGRFGDWPATLPTYDDGSGSGLQHDLQQLTIANDSSFLFLRIQLGQAVNLQESNLMLVMDTDNDPTTGSASGISGADFAYHFGNKEGEFRGSQVGQNDIRLIPLPTHSSDEFELGISRSAVIGGTALFQGDTIGLMLMEDAPDGDRLPDQGMISYGFDATPVAPFQPLALKRESSEFLRIMNYNVLGDGPLESHREAPYIRLLQAVEPDIIAFNEFFSSSAAQVQAWVNQVLPLGTGNSWYTVKLDRDNVTVSRYPIQQSWLVLPGHNITASLIDLPEHFGRDILVLNAHFRCCTANAQRQEEADAIVAFLRDAQTAGGDIDLPENTPFILLGDLNLVGFQQQLLTLLEGDIQDEAAFGDDFQPDWDGSDLEDLISTHTHERVAYTWRSEGSAFPAGRLDFMIYSGSVMNVEKSFILNTETMAAYALATNSLLREDSRASDHLPKVADFSFASQTSWSERIQEGRVQAFPNPATEWLHVVLPASFAPAAELLVTDLTGRTMLRQQMQGWEARLNLTSLPNGVYLLQVRHQEQVEVVKVVVE